MNHTAHTAGSAVKDGKSLGSHVENHGRPALSNTQLH
jgi:hypothetical protein